MNSFYLEHDKHFVAVDCIILGFDNGEIKLLLQKRKFEPNIGEWSLMGGFVGKDESVDNAAQRVLQSLTGLTGVYMEQLACFGDVNRDPGERTISIAYYALIKLSDSDQNLVQEHGASWISIKEIPELVFDHTQMVQKALRRLREKLSTKPIGFELLPEKFTLPQLQALYEAIYNEEIDKRKFRREFLETGLLTKLKEKDKSSSKKGAFLYKFNKTRYRKFRDKGFYFSMKIEKKPKIKIN